MNSLHHITLAALLHDIGRLYQRANGNGEHATISPKWLQSLPAEVVAAIHRHHDSAETRLESVLQAADWLAASEERRGKTTAQPQPALARLIPPAARVALLHARPEQPQQLLPGSLLLSQTALFPDETVLTDDEARANYQTLVAAFEADLARIPSLETRAGLVTLLAVLRKHTSLLPHTATGETDEPYATQEDVSLFDHVKLTAAIAACLLDETRFDDDTLAALARNDEAAATLPLARLVRGEFSGIQEFIYRITRAEADKGGTARRLRGRSFYVSLLVEVITDWLVRRLELTPANILFCGGGRFDLLVPLSATPTLESAEAELNEWLLKKFAGELSVEMVYDIEVRAQDCRDFSDVYRTADDRLAVRKQQKLRAFLDEEWFYLGYNEPRDDAAQAAPLHALCPACHLSPTEAAGALCADCEAQGKIGRWLPKPDTQFLTFIYGAETPDVPAPRFTFAKPFHVTVALLNQTEANACIEEFPEREIVISRLNQTDAFILDTPSNAHAFDFKFLGNAAPVAQTKIATGQTDSPYLQPGDVFDFANIAELLTTGAQFLGVLKMDIDNLGMLFSRGLEPRTLARVSALSRSLDLFFCGWLNAICAALTNDWKQQHPSKQAWTDSLFYVVYSGGDDLLIVGPWDQMIPLAQRIRDDFGKFTGKNPSITLSGGAVLVKPHFPVHRFAPLADEELQQSKRARDDAPIYRRYDKDRFTIFQQTVPWETHDNVAGLQEMMKFANNLVRDIEAGQVPKSLLYFLLRLYDEHIAPQKTKDDWPKGLVWIPKFNYAVARRVSDQKIGTALVEHAQKFIHRIRIPISYVSLKTRKE